MGLLLSVLAYNCATLGRVPVFLSDDDGAYASAASQFWLTGRPGVPGYRDVVGLGSDVWPFGRTAAAVQGVFLHFVGVSIYAALLPSFLAGGALLAVTAALGRRLWGPETGSLAGLLLAASGKFFEACRWTRPDILLALFFAGSLLLAASAPVGRPHFRLFLAGLMMGVAGDVHLNGFLIAPLPLLFWLLLRSGEKWERRLAILAFVGGGTAGAVFWLALHYWPHPEFLRHQAALYGGKTHGLRVVELGLIGALKAEGQRYVDWFWSARGHRHLWEGFCVLAGAVWVFLRDGRAGRALILVWIAFFLVAALFMSNPFGWYLILIWPLFALTMARLFLSFPVRLVARAGLVALFAAYLGNLALWGWKARQDVALQARVEQLRRLIPADAPVLGNGALWFAFWDRDFTDQYYLEFRELEEKLFPGRGPAGWAEEQRRLGWRYIVAFGDLRRFLDPEVPLEEMLALPVYRPRSPRIRAARAFSLARCSIEERLPGQADTILVLRIRHE